MKVDECSRLRFTRMKVDECPGILFAFLLNPEFMKTLRRPQGLSCRNSCEFPYFFLLTALMCCSFSSAAPLKALSDGQMPKDSRYEKPITLHDYHPFRPVADKDAWTTRQEHIKRRIQVGCGLWPLPTKTPLNAVVHGKNHMDGYTVERVFFESFPGHFVTGNLYRPSGESLKHGANDGQRPAVLCPHGHWSNARFYDVGEAAAKNLIAIGAERFMSAARNHIQARCVHLARMGCVVFHYDMLGNSDSMQFPIHRRGPREHMISPEMGKWGFVSPQAQSRLQTNFGLQIWNSIRALDFVCSLEEVDQTRLMVTGASGGGTQTQMLAAIDDRIDASFPCVMPSTAMQGGCTCENTHYLRIGQGNMDIAAAVAPRPQGMTAADDWTIELETKGAPDLFKLYEMVGAKGKFQAHYDIHFKHNYNHVSRTHMYNFVNRHFRLGHKSPVLERDFTLLGKEDLTVWSGDHSPPAGNQAGDDHERDLNRKWAEDSDKQIQPLLAPANANQAKKAREVLGGAVEIMIGRGVPAKKEVEYELVEKETRDGYLEMTGLIRNLTHKEEVATAYLFPNDWNGQVVFQVFPNGKAGLFQGDAPTPSAKGLVDKGYAVMSADLFRQGESLPEGDEGKENPRVQYPGDASKPGAAWRKSSVYYYGYNHSLFSRRVHDILTCLTFVRNAPKWNVKSVTLVGDKGAGHWAAAARAVAGKQIDRAIIDTSGFRFAKLQSDYDGDFVPGAVKYGDIAGFLVLSAPHPLWLSDNDQSLQNQLTKSYAAHGASDALQLSQTLNDLIK